MKFYYNVCGDIHPTLLFHVGRVNVYWNDPVQEALNDLKVNITSATLIPLVNCEQEFITETDASPLAVGTV